MSIIVFLQDSETEVIKDGASWRISYEDAQFPRLMILDDGDLPVAEFCRWDGVKKVVTQEE